MRLAKFFPEHFRDIVHSSYEASMMDVPLPDMSHLSGAYWDVPGSFHTIEDDEGRVRACVGVHIMWPGVGHAWAVVDLALPAKDGPKVAFMIRRLLDDAIEEHDLHRVQLETREQDARTERLAQSLGFVREGEMAMYGVDKSTWTRWARIARPLQ